MVAAYKGRLAMATTPTATRRGKRTRRSSSNGPDRLALHDPVTAAPGDADGRADTARTDARAWSVERNREWRIRRGGRGVGVELDGAHRDAVAGCVHTARYRTPTNAEQGQHRPREGWAFLLSYLMMVAERGSGVLFREAEGVGGREQFGGRGRGGGAGRCVWRGAGGGAAGGRCWRGGEGGFMTLTLDDNTIPMYTY